MKTKKQQKNISEKFAIDILLEKEEKERDGHQKAALKIIRNATNYSVLNFDSEIIEIKIGFYNETDERNLYELLDIRSVNIYPVKMRYVSGIEIDYASSSTDIILTIAVSSENNLNSIDKIWKVLKSSFRYLRLPINKLNFTTIILSKQKEMRELEAELQQYNKIENECRPDLIIFYPP
jgi:hypothetical protein